MMPDFLKNRFSRVACGIGGLLKARFFSDGLVFIWFLTLSLFLTRQRVFPYLYDDEYGILGAAAVLAGHDWTTPGDMPFYGFGFSLLIAPLYRLSLDPTTLYRAALAMNGLMVAISAVLALRTVRLVVPQRSPPLQAGMVVAAFSYPSVLFYTGLALGETMLLFCFTLIVYGLTALAGEKSRNGLMPVLLGAGLGLAPYAHTRGVIFWLAVLPVFGLALCKKWIKPKTIGAVFLPMLLIAGGLAFVKFWLVENFYSEVRSGSGSVGDFMTSRRDLLAPERLMVLFQVAWGQFTYLASASFGLVLVGCVSIFAGIRMFFRPERAGLPDDLEKRRATAAAVVGLSFVLMFAVSVMQLGTPIHTNHYFYGRYSEVVVPFVLMFALVFLFSSGQRAKRSQWLWFLGGVLVAALLVLSLRLYPADIFTLPTFWTQISGWFVYRSGAWKIQPTMLVCGISAGGLILVCACGISRRLFLLVLFSMFIAGLLNNHKFQHCLADEEWGCYAKVGAAYGCAISNCVVYAEPSVARGHASSEALQVAFPKTSVAFHKFPEKCMDPDVFFGNQHACGDKGGFIGKLHEKHLYVLNEKILLEIQRRRAEIIIAEGARKALPARLEISEREVVTGGVFNRACALAARFFYFGWARYGLPFVTVHVTRDGLCGTERQSLGFFITDLSGKWLDEWRADPDTPALARNETVKIRVPVRFNGRLPAGSYRLNVAIVDEEGWDWRSKASVDLTLR